MVHTEDLLSIFFARSNLKKATISSANFSIAREKRPSDQIHSVTSGVVEPDCMVIFFDQEKFMLDNVAGQYKYLLSTIRS